MQYVELLYFAVNQVVDSIIIPRHSAVRKLLYFVVHQVVDSIIIPRHSAIRQTVDNILVL